MLRFAQLFTCTALVASCFMIGCSVPRFDHVRVEQQTIETQPLNEGDEPEPIVKVDLSTFNGSIDIKPHDLSVVSMEVKYKAYGDSEQEAKQNADELKCEYAVEKGVLSVKAVKPANQWMASASFKLMIPRGCAVALDTSNGTVTVNEIEAAVSVDTSNGTINCIAITGDIQAKTSNGSIKIEDSQGSVNAKTSNGKVNYSGRLLGSDNKIQTSNGTVTLALDPTQLVQIESDTSNGTIKCSLPTQKITKEGKKHFYAVVGEGPESDIVKLAIKTSNGSIKIDPIRSEVEAPKNDAETPSEGSAELESGDAIAL